MKSNYHTKYGVITAEFDDPEGLCDALDKILLPRCSNDDPTKMTRTLVEINCRDIFKHSVQQIIWADCKIGYYYVEVLAVLTDFRSTFEML